MAKPRDNELGSGHLSGFSTAALCTTAIRDEIKSSGKISILSQFKIAGGEGVRAKVKV